MARTMMEHGRDHATGDTRPGDGERLQKVLAARGVASRRAAEELIQAGRVAVDGRVVRELGTRVNPERAEIRVDGRLVKRPRATYLLLNKPRGYLTTASDPEGRHTIYDLIDSRERVFPVGRLDMDSEGLLLLTNDGELANHVAHPRYRIDKEYHALVEETPTPQQLDDLRSGGVLVEGRRTSPAEIAILDQGPEGTWLRVIVHEGRKRQVRRMLEEVGHPVRRLRRVRLGPLTLGDLPLGSARPLTDGELARLRQLVGLDAEHRGATNAEPRPAGEAPLAARRARTRELGAGRPRARGNTPVNVVIAAREPARTTRQTPGKGGDRDGRGDRGRSGEQATGTRHGDAGQRGTGRPSRPRQSTGEPRRHDRS